MYDSILIYHTFFYPFFGNLTTNISITFMVNEQEPASALPMTVGMYGDVGEWSPPFLAYYLYVPIPNGGRLCPPHSFVPTKIFDIPAALILKRREWQAKLG